MWGCIEKEEREGREKDKRRGAIEQVFENEYLIHSDIHTQNNQNI